MTHETSTTGPIEQKVKWATIAASLAGFLLDGLSNWSRDGDAAALFTGVLPQWAEPFLTALLLGLPTFVAGWQAKHTHRPDLRTPPVV